MAGYGNDPVGGSLGIGPMAPLDPPTEPLPVPRRTHRWGLGAYLLAEAVFLVASVLVVLPFSGRAHVDLPPIALVLALTMPTVLSAGVALAATVLRGNGPRIDLGLHWSWRDLGIGVAVGAGGLLLTLPASVLWAWVVGSAKATSAVGEVFGGLRLAAPLAWAVFLAIWLLAPLCEEIVYRGLLWGALERRRWNRWLVFGVSTLLFAVAHLELTRTPLLVVVALPIGAARLITGRLPASVVAHQINNFLPAVGLLLVLLGKVPA